MPRLTNAEYLKRRNLIKALYDGGVHTQFLLGHLSLEKQQKLNYYYATYDDDKTDDELIEHRKWCDKNATLGSGKAFAELLRIVIRAMQVTGMSCNFKDTSAITAKVPQLERKLQSYMKKRAEAASKKYKNGVTVLPVARQEIDVKLLAQALIAFVQYSRSSGTFVSTASHKISGMKEP